MALRIVDAPIQTLGDMYPERQTFQEMYPGDYSGTATGLPAPKDYSSYALYNTPMMERERQRNAPPPRYEDIVPFTGNNFIGNLFDPDGSDARLAYQQRAQKYNQQLEQQANKNALIEMNMMKSIEAAPPGKRDAQLKLLQRWYQSQGKQLDPEILSFYKKADEAGFSALKIAGREMMKRYPDMNPDELDRLVNTDPQALIELFGLIETAKESQLKNEQTTLKNKRNTLMYERLKKLDTEAPESPTEAPMAPVGGQPQANVGMTAPSMKGVAFNQMVDTIGRQMGAPPAVINMVKASLAMETNGYDPNAVSPKGATGVGQFMPATAKQYGVQDPRNPAQAIQGMIRYYTALGGMFPNQPELQFAGYNAGEGAVQRAGNKVPNFPETQNYVQRGMQYLQGQPDERRANIPQGQMRQIEALEKSIAQDERRAEVLNMASGDPEIDREHDNLIKRIEMKHKRLEALERKYGRKYNTDTFEGWVGATKGVNPNQVPAPVLQRWEQEFEATKVRRKGNEAAEVSSATLGDRMALARAGNPAGIISGDAGLKYWNTTGEGDIHPAGMSNEQIQAENEAAIKKTGKAKWAVLSAPTEKERNEGNTSLESIRATDRILAYLDDPEIARFVGTVMSNPDAGLAKWIDSVWGGNMPEKYKELTAEIANTTSSILNARIGSAQTATEFKRLEPMIGSMSSVDASTLRSQMRTLRNSLARGFNTDMETMEGSGVAVPRNWKKVELLETALDKKPKAAATKEPIPETKPGQPAPNPIKQAIDDYNKRKKR